MPNNYDKDNDPTKAEAVQLLLDARVDVEACSNKGRTALMYGAAKGNVDVVQLLLRAGADTEACDKGGLTALMYGVFGGKVDAIQLLLEAGADIEARDDYGTTALDFVQDLVNDDVSAEDKARMIAVLKSHNPYAL